MQKDKMIEKGQQFRHGLYRLFETIGYEINDPGYKKAQNHILLWGGERRASRQTSGSRSNINEGEAIPLSTSGTKMLEMTAKTKKKKQLMNLAMSLYGTRPLYLGIA